LWAAALALFAEFNRGNREPAGPKPLAQHLLRIGLGFAQKPVKPDHEQAEIQGAGPHGTEAGKLGPSRSGCRAAVLPIRSNLLSSSYNVKALFTSPSQLKIFPLSSITSNLSTHAWSLKCR
jgi:hypothetical protein